MITLTQINAENFTTPLTDEQVLNLSLLVKKFPPYRDNSPLWPNLSGKLVAEQSVPTVKTKALKAVLTALGAVPSIVVESHGTDTSQADFSTNENWWELAELILNTLYEVPFATGRRSYAVVPVKITDLTLKERFVIRPITDTGRRY